MRDDSNISQTTCRRSFKASNSPLQYASTVRSTPLFRRKPRIDIQNKLCTRWTIWIPGRKINLYATSQLQPHLASSRSVGKLISVTYFDLSKAFDTAEQICFISKLDSLGIRFSFSWKISVVEVCCSGVPHESFLSSIPFLIHTRDLQHLLETDIG